MHGCDPALREVNLYADIRSVVETARRRANTILFP
jgi:hypothetical protein